MKLKNLPYMIKNHVLDICMRDVGDYYCSECMFIKKKYVTGKIKLKKSASTNINVMDKKTVLSTIDRYLKLSKESVKVDKYLFTTREDTFDLDETLKDQAIWDVIHSKVSYRYNAIYLGWLLYWIQRYDLNNVCRLYSDGYIHALFIYDQDEPIAFLMGIA